MVKGMKKAAYKLESGNMKIPIEEVKKFEEDVNDPNDPSSEKVAVGGFVRIQARVSRENFEFIQKEAYRTSTSISAIASIYIADSILVNKKKNEKTTDS